MPDRRSYRTIQNLRKLARGQFFMLAEGFYHSESEFIAAAKNELVRRYGIVIVSSFCQCFFMLKPEYHEELVGSACVTYDILIQQTY